MPFAFATAFQAMPNNSLNIKILHCNLAGIGTVTGLSLWRNRAGNLTYFQAEARRVDKEMKRFG